MNDNKGELIKENKSISFFDRFNKWNKRKKIISISISISILLIIGLYFGLSHLFSKKNNSATLNEGFHNVDQLVTQEWHATKVKDASKDRSLFDLIHIPFTKSYLVFSLDVEVIAGVNFKEIDSHFEEKNNEKYIRIILPHSQIYKYYQIPNSFNTIIDEENIFTNIGQQEQHDLENSLVEEGKNDALNGGLLDKADKNAENIIRAMLSENNETKECKVIFEYK